ncbi:MAG: hypothetical protein ACLSBH_07545 [Coprobacillus cateniformis]
MKIKDCINELDIKLLNTATLEKEVEGVYIGDLLSMVMAKANENSLWLTVQAHMNDELLSLKCLIFRGIIFPEGVIPNEDVMKKADELNLPLMSSQQSAYSLAKKMVSLGI